ncbi:MAG: chemotaxis protein CheW [Gemmatimonadetes bacterium]|nr:chemotaxis protein CheW [Gemmatimonadota bacterium]
MFRDGIARLLVFRVGPERFAVGLESVDEVVDAPAVQRMPDAAPTVLGISTIRGGLVTVYDPRPLLNVRGSVDGAALVFVRDGRRLAVAIDDVFDAITVEEAELLPAPGGGGSGGGAGSSEGILMGVVRRGSELIAVLDANALLDAATVVGEGERT